MGGAAGKILATFEDVVGIALPVRVRAWDGSQAGPTDSPARVTFRNRRALRRVLWSPNELGVARAYVSGDLEVDGDIYALLDVPDLVERIGAHRSRETGLRTLARAGGTFVRLGAVGPPPKPPTVEMRGRRGLRHTRARDAASVTHHYDVGNEFYRLFLGPTMVYSCAYWSPGAATLEDAQAAKNEVVCRKLGLRPGMRLLDVGCGWGSMVLHAARHHGVDAVGITLSGEQLELARRRVADAGLSDRVEIRQQDYRELDDAPYDAISSIGMSEHVGVSRLVDYAGILHDHLRPGGRLLNHAIASVKPLPDTPSRAPSFIDRYVFPDGEILPVSAVVDALERGGLEIRDTESLREHYALTLRAWVASLRESYDRAVDLVGAERARTWLLYLAASALGFEYPYRLSVHQVLAVRPDASGASGMARTRDGWYRDDPGHGRDRP
ncbi:class I SAM-dependent methyltransferase [Rhodococcus triatomae]|uniref:SAM-dependent methyltransferase n=1 Tax=Rhodococcus triatomae TaxID=300028 RepID=UPI000932C324|nr:cyclopropane-fatty-acyl-phospholipid synthase family protein [Rhodococcus triatomae]QNG19769.1 class I SAM-dependent methyltransferase [Rhodococcus triatomae]QNG24315.1 class I SAM-dependent methyltransferase [Rhodococcus triatomae]